MQFERSVNIEKFKEFIDLLHKRLGKKKVYLFMDNLNGHRSKKTIEHMHARNMYPIFNVAYSPEFNPIELLFSQVKQVYRKINTRAIVNAQSLRTSQWIDESFA